MAQGERPNESEVINQTSFETMETINLVFIGDSFYHESSKRMSSIYTEDGARYDWGSVKVALRKGNQITIRQARPHEKKHFNLRLMQIMAENKERAKKNRHDLRKQEGVR